MCREVEARLRKLLCYRKNAFWAKTREKIGFFKPFGLDPPPLPRVTEQHPGYPLQNPSEMIAYLIVTYVASASSSASNITNSQVPSKCFHTSAMDSTEGDHITLHISTETLFAQRKRQYTAHIHCRDQSLRRGYDHYILKDRSVRRFSPNFGIKVDEAIANFCGTIADV